MAFRQTGWFLADDRFLLKTWIQELREFKAVEQRIAGDKKTPTLSESGVLAPLMPEEGWTCFADGVVRGVPVLDNPDRLMLHFPCKRSVSRAVATGVFFP